MKRLALPLVVSVATHLVFVVVWRLLPDPEAAEEAVAEAEAETETEAEAETEIETEAEAQTEIAVELLPELAAPATIATTSTSTSASDRPGTPDRPPPPSPLAPPPSPLAPPRSPLAPPPSRYPPPIPTTRELAGRVAEMTTPPPPPGPLEPPRPRRPPKPRGEMIGDGNGARRVDESVFTARVAPDGRVRFDDKPNVQAHLRLPGRRALGEHLERWYKDPQGTATADERAVETATVPLVGGSFDVTDWAMRHAGMDPYQYRKLAMLDRTRDERAGMAATTESEALRESVATLPRRLRAIWKAPRWTVVERRRLLFELWDECAESGNDQVLAAARGARATIIAFIRRTLPAGSEHAYPAAELAALNAVRQSRESFAPYSTGPSPR